ncbi:MAG: hypothetical protein ABI766_10470 [Gemmatimonadales bacterium]
MLITFSGLDGSGKSTLIEWLRRMLEARQQRVAVFHMGDHIGLYAGLRAIRDRVVGSPRGRPGGGPPLPEPREPRGRLKTALRRGRNLVVWNKPMRRWIYLLDLVVFLGYRAFVEKLRGRVLILDRYFYDTLVDVADGRRWFWVRLLERITPTPTVAVFLDVTPEESWDRKGEYSVEYLRRRYAAYQHVFEWVPSAVQLVNDDLGETQAALWRAVADRGRLSSMSGTTNGRVG